MNLYIYINQHSACRWSKFKSNISPEDGIKPIKFKPFHIQYFYSQKGKGRTDGAKQESERRNLKPNHKNLISMSDLTKMCSRQQIANTEIKSQTNVTIQSYRRRHRERHLWQQQQDQQPTSLSNISKKQRCHTTTTSIYPPLQASKTMRHSGKQDRLQ